MTKRNQKKKPSVYRKLIDGARSLPEHEPRKVEPVKLREKVRDMLMTPRSAKRVAVDAYNILTDVRVIGSTVIAKRIPVDQLHRAMAIHVNRFTSQAIMQGGLPMSVHVVDRFKTIIDFGGGRCITIRVQLDMKPETQSTANFIVEESSKTFEEIDFDLVPSYESHNNKKEPTIKSATIWPERFTH